MLFATGPDHGQIAQCDSDVTDVRDVMVKAAVLTGDGRYKYAGYDTADLDSAWLLGLSLIHISSERNTGPNSDSWFWLEYRRSGNCHSDWQYCWCRILHPLF